jgi:hypothetical protein
MFIKMPICTISPFVSLSPLLPDFPVLTAPLANDPEPENPRNVLLVLPTDDLRMQLQENMGEGASEVRPVNVQVFSTRDVYFFAFWAVNLINHGKFGKWGN